MRQFSALICVMGCITRLFAQDGAAPFWKSVGLDDVALPETAYREFEPHEYFAYTLDYEGLVQALSVAPMEFTVAANKPVTVQLPNAQGQLEPFSVVESPVMMPQLWAENRQTRTYSGKSLQTPGKTVRCMFSPTTGFRAMVLLPDKGVEYIEPLARRQFQYYMVYNRKAIPAVMYSTDKRGVMEANPEMQNQVAAFRASLPAAAPPDRSAELAPVVVKEFRFAVSATHWFCWDHDTLKDKVFDHIVNYTNMLSAIYERDMAIRFKLVNNEKNVIFPDPATDPFAAFNNAFGWMSKNQEVANQYIGSANYDVGHVLARNLGPGPGGVGTIDAICNTQKAIPGPIAVARATPRVRPANREAAAPSCRTPAFAAPITWCLLAKWICISTLVPSWTSGAMWK